MRQSVVLLILTLMIVVSFTKKATTSVKTFQVSEETIQVSLETGEMSEKTASLCRQVNDAAGLTVQKRPTPNSPKVGTIDPNQRVKLIEGYRNIRGPAGRTWVQITYPILGFVSRGFPGNETNLRECSEVAKERLGEVFSSEEYESLCREIDSKKAPRGLAVRADASRLSEYRGKVPVDSQLILVDNYQLIRDKNGEKRKWVKISSPLRGFVSAGNLVECR
ncbi:MAG: SH3 domain-containing protein [Trichodesmium sp. St18_bin1]|nr:SH3 domain-containing protein [Trichodesmium sp. St18_bin1]MDE5123517.1 SH3 domain-containing protein [Trichodesmium sp. St19_bin1]